MPLKWANSLYWDQSSTVVIPVVSFVARGGYPMWQAGVIGANAGGMFQSLYRRLRDYFRHWRASYRVGRWHASATNEQRMVLDRTMRALSSTNYTSAQAAVRATAQTLGFRNREAWLEYARMLKANPNRAENVFRHVRACELTKASMSSTLTNPEMNLVVELAYCGFATKGTYFHGPQ